MNKPDPKVVKSRIAEVVFTNHVGLRVFLGILGVILAFGFLFGSTNSNYTALEVLFPNQVWAGIFATYGAARLWDVFAHELTYPVEVLVSGLGIWAINYVFLSFVVFDTQPIAPTEMLLAIPILAEILTLTNTIYFHKFVKPQNAGATKWTQQHH